MKREERFLKTILCTILKGGVPDSASTSPAALSSVDEDVAAMVKAKETYEESLRGLGFIAHYVK
jgi:hypothetical protein